ncbi:MAG: EAL domain-containing protein [Sphingomonadales bacterium]
MTQISSYGAEPEEPGHDRVHPGWTVRRTRTPVLAGRDSEAVAQEPVHIRNLPANFEAMLIGLDHAFQPIVNSHSGVCFGYEALLRNVDRYFIEGIHADNRKRFLLSHIVDIARLLGIAVIAEGVETDLEFLVCKELGCDLIQGYLVQHPTCEVGDLRIHYEDITVLSARERRRKTSDYHFIKDNMEPIEPIPIDTPMLSVLQKFSDRPRFAYFPVVDSMGMPLGVVREDDVKYFVYSRFGRDLLSNRSFAVTLGQIISTCPVVDINSRAEKILEVFSVDNPAQCAIVTENMHYVGTLNAQSLLGILTEKNLTMARDQNPLTRMAGNTLIEEFVSEALMDTAEEYTFAYFDFDYFKPFNDRYGFRTGDRAILLFSEIMRRTLRGASFLGHIGGDDFFAGFRAADLGKVRAAVARAQSEFAHEVSSLYDPEARAAGSIMGEDRSGNARLFPLMRVSAAVVRIPAERGIRTTDEIVQLMTSLKKNAKQAADNLAVVSLTDLPARLTLWRRFRNGCATYARGVPFMARG